MITIKFVYLHSNVDILYPSLLQQLLYVTVFLLPKVFYCYLTILITYQAIAVCTFDSSRPIYKQNCQAYKTIQHCRGSYQTVSLTGHSQIELSYECFLTLVIILRQNHVYDIYAHCSRQSNETQISILSKHYICY